MKSSRLPGDPGIPILPVAALRPAVRDASGPAERAAHELRLGRALQRGDRAVGAALWDYFSPLVRGLLARAFGPGEGVEDALQEIFLRVFHKGKTLRDPTRLRSFIVAVTVHFIRSELRKRRLRRAILLPLPRKPPPAEWTEPAGTPRLALTALYRALDALPVGERLAFTLRFLEGASLEEAAALAEMSLATFKRRLSAARRAVWASAVADPWLSSYVDASAGFDTGEGEP
jgi:RNA polymerase sigma-70 factor, ECF subfamily